jgi:hypothetical protein
MAYLYRGGVATLLECGVDWWSSCGFCGAAWRSVCTCVLSCLLCLNSGKLTNLMTNTAHVGKRPRNFVCIDFTFSYHCFWRCTLFPRNTFPRFHIQLSLLLDMYSCFQVFTRALRTVLHRFCQFQFASHCECIHLSTYMPRWELARYCVLH